MVAARTNVFRQRHLAERLNNVFKDVSNAALNYPWEIERMVDKQI